MEKTYLFVAWAAILTLYQRKKTSPAPSFSSKIFCDWFLFFPRLISHFFYLFSPCSSITLFPNSIILQSSSMDDILAETSSSNIPTWLDFNCPFYLHPSENAGSTLLPTVFDGSSYMSWIQALFRALSVKCITGFINGKVMMLDPADSTFLKWKRCDDMVTSWILNSLSPDLRDSL